MTKYEIQQKIEKMEQKIADSEEDLKHMRSPAADAMRATIPMMKDILAILKALVEVV